MKHLILAFTLIYAMQTRGQNLLDSVQVPVDHEQPAAEKFFLHFEFGAPYNPDLPTVFAIADGQQFWARKGRAARFQKELFGEEMNVVVIFGRVTNQVINAHLKDDEGHIQWNEAYRLFRSSQWVTDIESVRKAINPSRPIWLYGRSGGGLLLLQYLADYGKHVERAFCQSAVVHNLEYMLGFRHDKFWEEIVEYDNTLGPKLNQAISSGIYDRADLMRTLQRQNFFVEPSQILSQRKMLIEALAASDTALFDSLKSAYQVNAINEISTINLGIASAVRIFEFYMYGSFGNLLASSPDAIRPDLEVMRYTAQPFTLLYESGDILPPFLNLSSLHKIQTRVFLLAGRWDHTADYRAQYYLDGLIPNSILFLADDNHVFSRLNEDGFYGELVRKSLLWGAGSVELKKFYWENRHLRWDEWK